MCLCRCERERELVSTGGKGGGGHLMYSLLSMCTAMESSASNADTQWENTDRVLLAEMALKTPTQEEWESVFS